MFTQIFKNFNILDIGNTLEIKGVVYGNGKVDKIIMLPEESIGKDLSIVHPTLDEWNQIVRQSDILEAEVVGGDKNKKIILRKSTRQIDAKVSWEVFRRDDYKCRYCGADNVPLTVDHVVLWEEGGPTIQNNLITACKKCNHTRGNIQYEDWLQSDYYKKVSENLSQGVKTLNEFLLTKIDYIKQNLMRLNKRNR